MSVGRAGGSAGFGRAARAEGFGDGISSLGMYRGFMWGMMLHRSHAVNCC